MTTQRAQRREVEMGDVPAISGKCGPGTGRRGESAGAARRWRRRVTDDGRKPGVLEKKAVQITGSSHTSCSSHGVRRELLSPILRWPLGATKGRN